MVLPSERLVIIPDARSGTGDLWHSWLSNQLQKEGRKPEVCTMPDPYLYNNKRYESYWLDFLEKELIIRDATLVIAHGSAADALLRFLEKSQTAGCLLVSPADTYTAGERHGRPYVWPIIADNAGTTAMVCGAGDPFVSADEARRVKRGLGVPDSLFSEVPGGEDRFLHTSEFEAVLPVVNAWLAACNAPAAPVTGEANSSQ
ncbi:unnamed protein product [Phaeothamnion confervicola]